MEYTISRKMEHMRPSAIREIFKSLKDPSIIAFAAGNPASESFPTERIGALAAEIFSDPALATRALQYSITEGLPELIEQINGRLKQRFSIGRPFDATIVTSGGQQGIDLTSKVLCDEGDTVICENPSFIGALNAFRANGAKLTGIDMEPDGLRIDQLENALKNDRRVKLIYLIPTFHNPMGTTMSLEKRRAVYRLAGQYGAVILEDNPYGELRFAGEDIPTIKSMDEDGRVVYCSSFSKILSAGMRIGFLTAPSALIQKIVVAKQVNDVHSNIFFQMICSRFIERYGLDGHIADVRALYARKCGLMLSEMDKKLSGRVTYTRPEGGLFVWGVLPEDTDPGLWIRRAMDKKVAVVPGAAFLPDETAQSRGFRLTYATPSEEQIIKGIGLLAEALDEMPQRKG